ncbi:hypothetical protein ACIBI9_57850 [Nonomuraea sp. NPDC050451]|uniref:hypothetical protein n=1 Tax=Nonomuraea sp. NPDC050451 TaxID=3364364 RepID=UPI0037A03E4F
MLTRAHVVLPDFVTAMPSTLWEILKQESLDPTPERTSTTRPARGSQADALLIDL